MSVVELIPNVDFTQCYQLEYGRKAKAGAEDNCVGIVTAHLERKPLNTMKPESSPFDNILNQKPEDPTKADGVMSEYHARLTIAHLNRMLKDPALLLTQRLKIMKMLMEMKRELQSIVAKSKAKRTRKDNRVRREDPEPSAK